MIKAAFVVFAFLFSENFLLACPLGAKEERLTVQRVMRNFGRFVVPAELIAYRGQSKNEVITDEQLQDAIAKLSLAIGCANAVLENPTDEVLPVAALRLAEAEKAEYVESYLFYMQEFKISLTDYQAVYIKLLAQPANERDFFPLRELTRKQDALIDRAHRKL